MISRNVHSENIMQEIMKREFQIGYHYILGKLIAANIRYEKHAFASGARMINVWYGNRFFTLQFEKESIGFSEVDNDNPDFSTIPDERYFDAESFKSKMDALLQ